MYAHIMAVIIPGKMMLVATGQGRAATCSNDPFCADAISVVWVSLRLQGQPCLYKESSSPFKDTLA